VRDPIRTLLGHELRHGLRGWLFWVVPVGFMVGLTCALQPSLAKGLLVAKMDAMPEGLRKAFGLAMVDFNQPAAYLAANFMTTTLMTSLYAGLLGAAMIAKEETLRTAEMLYAQPISRTRVLLGKTVALATYVLAFPIVLGVVATAVLTIVAEQPVEYDIIVALFATACALTSCFGGVGMLVAALVRDKRSATGAALGVVLGSYIIGVVSALEDSVSPLRWLSPHKLADPIQILFQGFDLPIAALLVVLGAAAAAVAIALYTRQDIHA
jgi:ABC-2 type transport system permease protein